MKHFISAPHSVVAEAHWIWCPSGIPTVLNYFHRWLSRQSNIVLSRHVHVSETTSPTSAAANKERCPPVSKNRNRVTTLQTLWNALTFPWLLTSSLTFPGFPGTWSPCKKSMIEMICTWQARDQTKQTSHGYCTSITLLHTTLLVSPSTTAVEINNWSCN